MFRGKTTSLSKIATQFLSTYTISALFLFSACLPQFRTLLVSPNDIEQGLSNLSLLTTTPTNLLLAPNEIRTVKISGGNAPYVVSVLDNNLASVSSTYVEQSGGTFKVAAGSVGNKSTSIKIIDLGTNQQMMLVPVYIATSNVSLGVSPPSPFVESPNLVLQNNQSTCLKFTILGGTAAYKVSAIESSTRLMIQSPKVLGQVFQDSTFSVCSTQQTMASNTSAVYGLTLSDSKNLSLNFYIKVLGPGTTPPNQTQVLTTSPTSSASQPIVISDANPIVSLQVLGGLGNSYVLNPSSNLNGTLLTPTGSNPYALNAARSSLTAALTGTINLSQTNSNLTGIVYLQILPPNAGVTPVVPTLNPTGAITAGNIATLNISGGTPPYFINIPANELNTLTYQTTSLNNTAGTLSALLGGSYPSNQPRTIVVPILDSSVPAKPPVNLNVLLNPPVSTTLTITSYDSVTNQPATSLPHSTVGKSLYFKYSPMGSNYSVVSQSPNGCLNITPNTNAATAPTLILAKEPYPATCPVNNPVTVVMKDGQGHQGSVSITMLPPPATTFFFRWIEPTSQAMVGYVYRDSFTYVRPVAGVAPLKIKSVQLKPTSSNPAWTTSSTDAAPFSIEPAVGNADQIFRPHPCATTGSYVVTLEDSTTGSPQSFAADLDLNPQVGTGSSCPAAGQFFATWNGAPPTATVGAAHSARVDLNYSGSAQIKLKEFKYKAVGSTSFTTVSPIPITTITEQNKKKLFNQNYYTSYIDLTIPWTTWSPSTSGEIQLVFEDQSVTLGTKPTTTLSGWMITASGSTTASVSASPPLLVIWNEIDLLTSNCPAGTTCYSRKGSTTLTPSLTLQNLTLSSIVIPSACVGTGFAPIGDLFEFVSTSGIYTFREKVTPRIIGGTNTTPNSTYIQDLRKCLDGKNITLNFSTTDVGKSVNPLSVPIVFGRTLLGDAGAETGLLDNYKDFLNYGGLTKMGTSQTSGNTTIQVSFSSDWPLGRFLSDLVVDGTNTPKYPSLPMYTFGSTLRMAYDYNYNYPGTAPTPTLILFSTRGYNSSTSQYENGLISRVQNMKASLGSTYSEVAAAYPTANPEDCAAGGCSIQIPLTNLPRISSWPANTGISYRGRLDWTMKKSSPMYSGDINRVFTSLGKEPVSGYTLDDTREWFLLPNDECNETANFQIDFCIDPAQPKQLSIKFAQNIPVALDDDLFNFPPGSCSAVPPSMRADSFHKVIPNIAIPSFLGGKTHSAFQLVGLKNDHWGKTAYEHQIPGFYYGLVEFAQNAKYFSDTAPIHITPKGHNGSIFGMGFVNQAGCPASEYPYQISTP